MRLALPLFICFISVISLGSISSASASSAAESAADSIETKAQYAYMVDVGTGTVLLNKNADKAVGPSSMSKLMTLYVLFSELKKGAMTLEDRLTVSETAWKKGGSKMFVHMNSPPTVEELIRGIIVQSGNDACIVVAEHIAGSEEAFALRMNQAAKQLGLNQSHFKNATGWPDEQHVMSMRDVAHLAIALMRDFPEYYHYFAETEFTYANITQTNRNRLVGGALGVDGLKTGHTEAAGYGIALSANDAINKRRVVLVVNGLPSDAARIGEGARLLTYGLKAYENREIISQGQLAAQLPVWFGAQDSVAVVTSQAVISTVARGQAPARMEIEALSPLKAPITKGAELATLHITHADNRKQTIPLLASQDVRAAQGMRWLKLFFRDYLLGNSDHEK